MDADVQGGKTVPIKSSQAPLFPLPRPFSCGEEDHMFELFMLWEQLISTSCRQTLSAWVIYTSILGLYTRYTVFICVLYSLSEWVCTSSTSKPDPSDAVLFLPLPFTGAAEPWQQWRRCKQWLVCCLRGKECGQGEAQPPESRDWRAGIQWQMKRAS